MNIILVSGVLFAMIFTNSAWIMQNRKPSIHKDFPNQCYVPEDKKGYPIGTTNPIGICKSVECNSDFTYSQSGCGVMAVPDGFHNEPDLTKEYPDCCFNIVEDKQIN